MTRQELCVALEVTPMTTFNWQRQGMPKKLKVVSGTKWRWDFEIDKVNEWLEKRKKGDVE